MSGMFEVKQTDDGHWSEVTPTEGLRWLASPTPGEPKILQQGFRCGGPYGTFWIEWRDVPVVSE